MATRKASRLGRKIQKRVVQPFWHQRVAPVAGNFADVFKHSILVELLASLNTQSRAWSYMDFHAGRGLYEKNRLTGLNDHNYETGIDHLMNHVHNFENQLCMGKDDVVEEGLYFQKYINTLRDVYRRVNKEPDIRDAKMSFNKKVSAQHALDLERNSYPTATAIAREFMRSQDRALLVEDEAEEYEKLEEFLGKDRRFKLFRSSPTSISHALVPPRTSTGLAYFDCGPMLLNPDPDRYGEYVAGIGEEMLELIHLTCKRWPNAIKAITYPIRCELDNPLIEKARTQYMQAVNAGDVPHRNARYGIPPGEGFLFERARPVEFIHNILQTGQTKILNAEMYVNSTQQWVMGQGMVIINPPYAFDQYLEKLVPQLHSIFNPDEPADSILREPNVAWLRERSFLDEPDRWAKRKVDWNYSPSPDVTLNQNEIEALGKAQLESQLRREAPVSKHLLRSHYYHQDSLSQSPEQMDEAFKNISVSSLISDQGSDSTKLKVYGQELENKELDRGRLSAAEQIVLRRALRPLLIKTKSGIPIVERAQLVDSQDSILEKEDLKELHILKSRGERRR